MTIKLDDVRARKSILIFFRPIVRVFYTIDHRKYVVKPFHLNVIEKKYANRDFENVIFHEVFFPIFADVNSKGQRHGK